MAVVERAIAKPSFLQVLADKFRAAYLSLGLPVLCVVAVSVGVALLRGLL